MKRSDIIKEEIDKLNKELEQTLVEEAKILLWKDDFSADCETIGFNNITKMKAILNELHKGSVLLCEHGAFGEFKVWMNPQRNRTFVFPVGTQSQQINEGNVVNFMLRYPTTWFILNE